MGRWNETHEITISESCKTSGPEPVDVYSTNSGTAYLGDSKRVLESKAFQRAAGRVQLAFTSPPFPLNNKKSYGNLQGAEYVEWFASFAAPLRDMLTDDGSIVIEIGNAWMPGEPVMSTDVLRAFLRFLEAGDLHLCQEFIWYNPARLPSPVEWVNKERVRVKDAFTRVWWMSPTTRPKADNRNVLREYSPSMKRLIETGKYNAGARPSEHQIGKDSFKTNNKGAIPPNVGGAEAFPSLDTLVTPKGFAGFLEETTNLLKAANTLSSDGYHKFCVERGVKVHPARMPKTLVEFFIKFLTDEDDLVLDPFAGSNTTGAVAESLARQWLSIEADWDYAANSIGRFEPEKIVRTADQIMIAEMETVITDTGDSAQASAVDGHSRQDQLPLG